MLLEFCAGSPEDALAAARAGADRVELCVELPRDGLTPPRAQIEAAAAALAPLGVPLVVLARPRDGDFVYAPAEIAAIEATLDVCHEVGAEGVALGVLRADGRLDVERCAALLARAAPLAVCFHRAFDAVPDARTALDELVALGCRRVLSSGGAARAIDALRALAGRERHAAGRIEVVPAGRIRGADAAAIAARTGARSVHSSAGGPRGVAALRAALDAPPPAR